MSKNKKTSRQASMPQNFGAPAPEPWTPKQWEALFREMIAASHRPKGRAVPHPLRWDGVRWIFWVLDVCRNGGQPTETFRP